MQPICTAYRRLVTVALLLAVLTTLPAQAHKPSDSYLNLQNVAGQLAVQWDIALRDLDYALGLDSDGDGAITGGNCVPAMRPSPTTLWPD